MGERPAQMGGPGGTALTPSPTPVAPGQTLAATTVRRTSTVGSSPPTTAASRVESPSTVDPGRGELVHDQAAQPVEVHPPPVGELDPPAGLVWASPPAAPPGPEGHPPAVCPHTGSQPRGRETRTASSRRASVGDLAVLVAGRSARTGRVSRWWRVPAGIHPRVALAVTTPVPGTARVGDADTTPSHTDGPVGSQNEGISMVQSNSFLEGCSLRGSRRSRRSCAPAPRAGRHAVAERECPRMAPE
jgi:hypothetical protein